MVGNILTIYSSKGGVGKSFIAVNLSVDLHLNTKKKVLLIDFSLPFSNDIAQFLNVNDIKSMENIFPAAGEISTALLKSFATPHSSGIYALCLSRTNSFADDSLNNASVEALFTKLRLIYDFIVVDIGIKYSPIVEKIFDLSSLIILPVLPDSLSIHQTRNDLKLLRNKNFTKDMILLAANMVGKSDCISQELLEQQLGKNLSVSIPHDSEAASKMAEGVYPQNFPRHPVTKAFDTLTFEVINHLQVATSAGASLPPSQLPDEIEALQDTYQLKSIIHSKLLESIDFKKIDTEVQNSPEKMKELYARVSEKIVEIIDNETTITSREFRDKLLREALQEALGLGPLEDLLADTSISEIMVNRWDQIYIERKGKIEEIPNRFFSEQHLMNIINRIVSPVGRKIDTSTPMVDARLADGSRVNAIIPPLAIKGAALTIRKFAGDRIGIPELIQLGTANKQILEFLKAAVQARLNILVSGGTGTGKTTFLNILSSFIPSDERIVTVEDSAELQLKQRHVITLESRPPNIEGKGDITIRDLVKNCLRMRPDRIVVGECRGAEALDMLQAMNTGHDGSLTTIHANNCREALSRLETLVMLAGFELPSKAIREQIIGAIDLVIHLNRYKDGSRKIMQIAEITGMEGTAISMGDVFTYEQTGEKDGKVVGNFASTGYVPRCLEKFTERGITIPREILWTN